MSKAAELAKWGEVSTNGQVSGRRNIVINGAMNVAQRSASVTGLGGNQTYSTVDRFRQNTANTAGRFTMTQTADGPTGFANCMKLDCTTADTSIAAGEVGIIQYKIEGQDVQQIKKGTSDAEKVNVSFYVKGNANATYVCELEDVDNSRINTQAFNVTTSWTRVVLTFAADTTGALDDDNAESLALNIWLHAGSTYSGGTFSSNTWASKTNANRAAGITSFFDSTDRTFFLTGLQMEVGGGVWYLANQPLGSMAFAPTRANPTMAVSSADALKCYGNSFARDANDTSCFDLANAQGWARLNFTPATNGNAGDGATFQINSDAEFITIDAEL